jgi:hypothetical protein
MSPASLAATSDLLLSARTIYLAGQDLQEALQQNDPSAIEFAVTGLEQAYTRYDQAGERYRRELVPPAAATRAAPEPTAAVASDDTAALAGVITDLQVSQLLLVAGRATGEGVAATRGARSLAEEPVTLSDALQALDTTARALRAPLMPATAPAAAVTRGGVGPAAAARSLTLAEALQTLSQTAQATLTQLVDGVYGAIRSCIDAISNLDQSAILAALRALGAQALEIPDVGRLLRLGIDRLQKAIAAITEALGGTIVALIKMKIETMVREWLGAQRVQEELSKVLEVEEISQIVAAIAARDDLIIDRVDDASAKLQALGERFRQQMVTIDKAARTVSIIGGLLLTSGLGSQAALLTAAAYLAVIAWAIVLGMDYADAGGLQRVAGVRVILSEVG